MRRCARVWARALRVGVVNAHFWARVRQGLDLAKLRGELFAIRSELEDVRSALARIENAQHAPRLCTVLLLGEDYEGRGWYAARSFTLPRQHDRVVEFHPQQALAKGAWLVALGGCLLSSVRVGQNCCDVGPSDSAVARIGEQVQIMQTISCRAMWSPAYPPEEHTLERARL